MMYQYLGGIVLALGGLLITYNLIKQILELDAMVVAKEREMTKENEEDWEGDIDKWKDYPYDEFDSRDE